MQAESGPRVNTSRFLNGTSENDIEESVLGGPIHTTLGLSPTLRPSVNDKWKKGKRLGEVKTSRRGLYGSTNTQTTHNSPDQNFNDNSRYISIQRN